MAPNVFACLKLSEKTGAEIKAMITRHLRMRYAMGSMVHPLSSDSQWVDTALILHYPSLIDSHVWIAEGAYSFLLPGGRWLITSASNGTSLHLFCWDIVSKKSVDTGSIEPVLLAQCASMGAAEDARSSIKVQYDPVTEGAILLVYTMLDEQE